MSRIELIAVRFVVVSDDDQREHLEVYPDLTLALPTGRITAAAAQAIVIRTIESLKKLFSDKEGG